MIEFTIGNAIVLLINCTRILKLTFGLWLSTLAQAAIKHALAAIQTLYLLIISFMFMNQKLHFYVIQQGTVVVYVQQVVPEVGIG